LQRFGFEKTPKVETLQEIIDEMGEGSRQRRRFRAHCKRAIIWTEGNPLAIQIMTKAKTRTRKPKRQITDWNIGQPLAFPQKKTRTAVNHLAREAVAEAMRGPFRSKRQKRKKK